MVENFFLWIYVLLGHTHNSKHKYVEKYIIIITIICDHDAVSAKNACPDGYA